MSVPVPAITAPYAPLHGLGAALLAARIAHPFGIDPEQLRRPLRGIAAGLTMIVILISIIALLLETL